MKIKASNLVSVEKKKYLLKKTRNILNSNLDDTIQLDSDQFLLGNVSGIFVTLKNKNKLRGCIGKLNLESVDEEVLYHVTTSAMKNDNRFVSISKEELSDIKIEITLLELPELIENIEKIVIGEHGILLKNGANQGLLLPQVAVEHKFDIQTFLEHTSLKAGLNKNDWKDKKTKLFIFKGEVFGE